MTILIADDHTLVLKLIANFFEKNGHKVLTATDGKKAQTIFATDTPDIIFTDLLMPFGDGLELIHYVRTLEKSNIPIIVISAVNDEQTMRKALEIGANYFISKPFSLNDLADIFSYHTIPKK